MQAQQRWLITGVTRGLGRALAEAALASGALVVGTSRDGRVPWQPARGTLHLVALEMTEPQQAAAAVESAVRIAGGLDVLVNNAGYGLLGALESTSEDDIRQLFEVNVFAPLRVTRAVLPHLRRQRSGHIVTLSSIAGVAPSPGAGLYAASKAALGAACESLAAEVGPLGIRVTVVEPGAFRTDFLSERSIRKSAPLLEDYEQTAGATLQRLAQMDGRQAGDPRLAAARILEIVASEHPPLHLLLGADALARARTKLDAMTQEVERWSAQTLSTDCTARG
jgi:NAD(P)-dependent dehydrogenase (short-subunit alcohol dehydrogenase family)